MMKQNTRSVLSSAAVTALSLALVQNLAPVQIASAPAFAQTIMVPPTATEPAGPVATPTGNFTLPASDAGNVRQAQATETRPAPSLGSFTLPRNGSAQQPASTPSTANPSTANPSTANSSTANPSTANSSAAIPSTANSSTANSSTSAQAQTGAGEALVPRMILKPGKSLSIGMTTEDIICTNDVDLARKQRESYPDSPEASFIYAVALSRTSHVEDALKEVRRARRLAEKQGGPGYFDKMIETYENMLTYYPNDNQVRYHLAWAYYMKAYVLAKYSHLANTPQAKYKEWVAQASKPGESSTKADEPNTKAGEASTQPNQTAQPMYS